MTLATEVAVAVRVLRIAVVLLAVGAVGLFGRMSPAIERILDQNVVTLVACEDMLAALALTEDDGKPAPSVVQTFEKALSQAIEARSLSVEDPLLDRLGDHWRDLLEGTGDRQTLVTSIRALSKANRQAMREADDEANRLGAAGGWAVVVVCLVIVIASYIFAGRLDHRMVQPLLAVEDAVRSSESGDGYRRCAERGAPEIRAIAKGLNQLMDQAASWRSPGPAASPARDRALLSYLLDGREGAWAALDPRREVVIANAEGRSRLSGSTELGVDLSIEEEEEVVPGALRLVRFSGEHRPDADPDA